ncbi:hypothetical protein BASA81_016651 [Batrachochytrium salamandrivorans]|nr:hypothetical protein BASA81_016651 [Batrachochytrium salamandrivorans]
MALCIHRLHRQKDGDPLNPGDKRGIALINVGLKLVCKVLQMRIERFVETNNLLSYEQAGFRKREEWLDQSRWCTVMEAANMGFPRRTLAFSRHCTHHHLLEQGQESLTIGPIPGTERGQTGCPLSGLLFNLFINDILDGVAPITVPDYPRDTNPIRGLMYADDVAVFADSEHSLLAASTAMSNGQSVGNSVWCGQVWHHQLHWPI